MKDKFFLEIGSNKFWYYQTLTVEKAENGTWKNYYLLNVLYSFDGGTTYVEIGTLKTESLLNIHDGYIALMRAAKHLNETTREFN